MSARGGMVRWFERPLKAGGPRFESRKVVLVSWAEGIRKKSNCVILRGQVDSK